MNVGSEELLGWLKLEKPASRDVEGLNALKLGDYEVYSERLNLMLTEAREVFERTVRASLGSAADLIVGLYTQQGDMVSCSTGTYLHAVATVLPVKYIMKVLSQRNVGVEDGDVWFANDASFGGIHNPDMIVMTPVFNEGEHIAWTAAATHTAETGATIPGGMNIEAKSKYYEGLRSPPIKIGERFTIRDDLLNLLNNFASRAPAAFETDLRARAAAADKMRLKAVELTTKKNNEFLLGLFRKMMTAASDGARIRIKRFDEGVYRSVSFMDSIGLREVLYRISLSMRKRRDRLTFDFTGTSPENEGSFHAYPWAVVAHSALILYGYLFPDLPVSTGTFEPIDFVVPKGTCLHPSPDAACSMAVVVCSAVMSTVTSVVARMLYHSESKLQCAASCGNLGGTYALAGKNPWGGAFSDITAYQLNTEGQGARCDMDGTNAYGFSWCHWGRAPDIELIESEMPVLHLYARLWKDSGGPGKYRGGCGSEAAIAVHSDSPVYVAGTDPGSNILATGPLFGGYGPNVQPGVRIISTDLFEKMTQGDIDIPSSTHDLLTLKAIRGDYHFEPSLRKLGFLKKGDIFLAFDIGGSGYGDPLERDPSAVMKDMRDGQISSWVATNVYKVVYKPDSGDIELEDTARLRSKERDARKSRARPYAEFEREWLQRRPPAEILDCYGRWPDATPVRQISRE